MNLQIHNLIKLRAERIFPILREQLLCDQADYDFGNAFRFSYLILRKPKAYLLAFENGELKIDVDAVDGIYYSFRQDIPGAAGLITDEREIISRHNFEVEDYLTQRQPSLGLRTVIGSTATTNFRIGS